MKEVVENNVTGFLVETGDIEARAAAMEKLVLNEALRTQMGKAGRNFVQKQFDFSSNLEEPVLLTSRC